MVTPKILVAVTCATRSRVQGTGRGWRMKSRRASALSPGSRRGGPVPKERRRRQASPSSRRASTTPPYLRPPAARHQRRKAPDRQTRSPVEDDVQHDPVERRAGRRRKGGADEAEGRDEERVEYDIDEDRHEEH